MTSRLCTRCQSILHREDQGTLIFCWNCGAPQVTLSEELREQIEKQIAGQNADPSAIPLPQLPSNADTSVWKGAIQCAGLAAAVAATFELLSFVLPPVGLLSLFWLMAAPAFALIFYSGRFRQARITPAFGARLGMLAGLLVLLANSALNTLGLLFLRFVFHSTASIDTQLDNAFRPMQLIWSAQFGPVATAWFATPEFRAGIVLLGCGMFLLFYLAFSATSGAFAGYLRSRARR